MRRAFDVSAFITNEFGSAPDLYLQLEAAGIAGLPSRGSAYRWSRRGSMPGPLIAAAIALREKDTGRPLSVAKYLKREKKQCNESLAKPASSGTPLDVFG